MQHEISESLVIELIKQIAQWGALFISIDRDDFDRFENQNGMTISIPILRAACKSDYVRGQLDEETFSVKFQLTSLGAAKFVDQFPGFKAVNQTAMKALPTPDGTR